jgi:hypothetical protein
MKESPYIPTRYLALDLQEIEADQDEKDIAAEKAAFYEDGKHR